MTHRTDGRSRRARRPGTRTAGLAVAVLAALGAVALTPVASHADSSTTITVVGTSDVFDSDLVQQVIKPDFERAYPQYTLNYVSQGTGAAINYAEAGTASALLVHAASLENQFVADGYSLEQYGRAVFYGDYVLLAPATDPAGVLSGGQPTHDIVSAFEKIAAAGAAGHANFVSRGGTPGTTVQEHAIWADTTGVTTCPVSTANGGGAVPDTTGGAGCSVPPSSPPSWYHVTGLTQGPNVVAADACNFPSNDNDCYVLTDRGTYQYLESQAALQDLHVVVNDEGGTTAQQELLVNSFHAYAIQASKFSSSSVQINTVGATAFLNWLTSPSGQADVNAYDPGNTGNPPFKEDAAPALTASLSTSTLAPGGTLTISGALTNKVPGTTALAGVEVTLSRKSAAGTTRTAATTDAGGKYSFTVKPTATARYTVSSAKVSQVEIPASVSFGPLYGDLLQPASTSAGTVKVTGSAAIKTLAATKQGAATVTGTLSPRVVGGGATLRIYAARSGRSFSRRATETLRAGAKTFTAHFTLPVIVTHGPGTKKPDTFPWRVRVVYSEPGVIVAATSASKTVRVP